MPTTWPLVGRTAELAAVAAAMDAGGGGVLLAGPAGVGKTRPATECLELAEGRGWSTGVVRANQAVASIPYGAFAPHLPIARAALRRKAAASARHAAALLAGCEGARPFVAVPDLPGVGLTPREREVAELAARDLTSREIAERLVLSARTVENHLQRAYEKLGVGGRRELREALTQGTEPE